MENIRMIQNLALTNTTLITQDLKDTIVSISTNQVNLVIDGKSPMNKELLNMLDFSLQLTMYE